VSAMAIGDPAVLMHQDRRSRTGANFHIILCGPPYPMVDLPL